MADSLPAYERIPTIPPFSIMAAPDSTKFSKEDLKRKQPLIFIVFSPDCDHCKHFTKELLAKYDMVKKARIVMASSLNYDLIRNFYLEDKIVEYPQITMGRDANYFLGTFFSVRTYPTVVVYNKKGKFVKRFDGAVTVEKIADAL
jgi:thioredoxin-related protein